MTRRRFLAFLLFLVSAAGVGAATWAQFFRPLEVAVIAVEHNVPIQVFGLGTVEARVLSRVGLEASGTLIELHADFGDRVAAGTLLARLSSREQEARLAQARAAVVQAESAIRQALAGIEHAQAVVTQKAQVNDRRQQLVQRGNVSTEAAEDARAAYDIARADLTQARSAVETARANLEQTRAAAAFEEARLAKYALYSPYDAVVVSRNRELGAMLNPGEQLFTLVDPKTVWVLAYVDEAKAGRVAVGQRVEITLRSFTDRRFSGRVMRIDIESDRVNEERKVYARCDDCPTAFHLGEQAEVVIDIAELAVAQLVPQATVERLEGQRGIVWTVENGRLAQRPVVFGQRTLDGRLEILEGLPSDALVVLQPKSGFRVGRRATVPTGGRP